MKISKKNRKLAYELTGAGMTDPDEDVIAQELQKRDDQIKALRAQIQKMRARAARSLSRPAPNWTIVRAEGDI